MDEKKEEETKKDEVVKENPEEKLEYCNTAPSAEHARASDDDEPCDDRRG